MSIIKNLFNTQKPSADIELEDFATTKSQSSKSKTLPTPSSQKSLSAPSESAHTISKTPPLSKIEKLENEKLKIINSVTKSHNIKEIDTKLKTNKYLSTLLVFLVYGAIIAGIVGIGGILPGSVGILGIPQDVAIGLISLGGAVSVSLIGFLILSKIKPDCKVSQYFKDILQKRSNWFLDSNLNDFLGILAYGIIIAAPLLTAVLNADGINTLQGVLNYPFGALLIFSGLYQGVETIKKLRTLLKENNKEKLAREFINLLNSAVIIAIGFFACANQLNSDVAIALNFVNGGLSTLIAAWLFVRCSYKTLKDIRKVNTTDPNSIMHYLKQNLEITKEESEDIKKEMKAFDNKKIVKWIKNNLGRWDKDLEKKWLYIKAAIEANKLISLEKIKEDIINEEIQKTIDSKLEDFRALVNEQTYKDTLKIVEEYNRSNENYLKTHDKEIIDLFARIKSQVKVKMGAEISKCILYIAGMVVPIPKMFNPSMNPSYYNYSQVFLNAWDLGINLFPRFRNVPPAIQKIPLDINSQINQTLADQNTKGLSETRLRPLTLFQKVIDIWKRGFSSLVAAN